MSFIIIFNIIFESINNDKIENTIDLIQNKYKNGDFKNYDPYDCLCIALSIKIKKDFLIKKIKGIFIKNK